jgi:hypothetical protein
VSQQNPTPDDIYWQKAMLEPVAPATLWIYPELKLLATSKKRATLAAAELAARQHWLSRGCRYLILALALVGVWSVYSENGLMRTAFHYVLPGTVLASTLINHLLKRAELRSARS